MKYLLLLCILGLHSNIQHQSVFLVKLCKKFSDIHQLHTKTCRRPALYNKIIALLLCAVKTAISGVTSGHQVRSHDLTEQLSLLSFQLRIVSTNFVTRLVSPQKKRLIRNTFCYRLQPREEFSNFVYSIVYSRTCCDLSASLHRPRLLKSAKD